MIFGTQFLENVTYCRANQECFAVPWEEGCGSAEELRESIQGPPCKGEDGKVVDEVFLVTTYEESDKCARRGLKKDKAVANAGNFVESKVPSAMDISFKDDNDVVESSCTESTIYAYWFVGKFVCMWLFLCVSCYTLYCHMYRKTTKVAAVEAVRILNSFFLFFFACHPWLSIFLSSGCKMYTMLYKYEMVTTVLDLLSFFYDQVLNPDSTFNGLSKAFTIGGGISIFFDISGLVNGQLCPDAALNWSKLMLTGLLFLFKLIAWRRNSTKPVESESDRRVIQSDLAYPTPGGQPQRYSTGGQPIARI